MIGNFAGMAGPGQIVSIDNKQVAIQVAFVNHDLIETMGIKVSAGRTFKKEFNDVDKIVVNQKTVDALNMTDPVGKAILFGGRQVEIIGVVENFHMASLHQEIVPVVFELETEKHWNIFVRLEERDQRATLSRIVQHVQKLNPGLPFDFRFLKAELDRQYKAEERIGLISAYSSAVAIFISMLGLFALAAFVCRRRIKEIGIRKAIGASAREILFMLSSFFLKLSLLATIASLPIAFYFANEWLSSFAYAVNIELWMLLVTGVAAVMLVFAAIGGFVIRASMVNPASILKSE
jgi:putative ABC transport system permease protein